MSIMPKKIDAKQEKRDRNKLNALQFKSRTAQAKENKVKGGKFANWCRVKGHPADCDVRTCTHP